jgi:hypothetical protein
MRKQMRRVGYRKMKFKIQNPAVLVRDCWRQAHIAETDASDHASAACYRSLKDRRIVTMVMPELKFGNKKRHVLLAHLVEGAIAEGSDFLAPACDDRWTLVKCAAARRAMPRLPPGAMREC